MHDFASSGPALKAAPHRRSGVGEAGLCAPAGQQHFPRRRPHLHRQQQRQHVEFSRNAAGKILVNGGAPRDRRTPTVANTKLIHGVRPGRQRRHHAQRDERRAAEGEPVRRRRQRHADRRLGRRPAVRRGRQRHAARQGRQRRAVRRRGQRRADRRRRRRPDVRRGRRRPHDLESRRRQRPDGRRRRHRHRRGQRRQAATKSSL